MDDTEKRFTAMYEAHYDAVARFVRRRAPDVDLADVLARVFLATVLGLGRTTVAMRVNRMRRRLRPAPAGAGSWFFHDVREGSAS